MEILSILMVAVTDRLKLVEKKKANPFKTMSTNDKWKLVEAMAKMWGLTE